MNDLKKPVAERLFFVQPTSGLMISEQVGSRDYAPRSKVAVQLSSKDEQGKSTTTGLSVAVYKLDAMNGLEPADISSYLWLTSDLKGTVESPKYYLTEKGKDVEAAADNLMLTHGWRRFIWTDRSDSGKAGWSFLPEFTSHIIYARIINTRTEQPAPNMLAYLSVPGKRIQLYSSKSDSAGNLKFYTTDFYGSNEIMLQTEEQGDTSYRFEIVNPFSEKQSGNKFPAFSIAADMQQSLTDYNVGVQVQNTFWGEKIRQLFSPAVDSTGFFGPPDNSYFLDDYVRFSTMEEVLREYVVEVLVRRQKETFRLIMSGGLENRVFLDDPLTLFNGVPVFDPNKIMQYDPLKIHKIEVVRRRYFYGPAIMNGIVNFVSFQPDPTMLSGLRAVVFDYEGVQLERQFYSPKYETPEQFASRAPDFRNVLYWSPGITTSADGKAEFSFYTSDQKGGFAVVVQGLNAEGKAGVKVFPINVK